MYSHTTSTLLVWFVDSGILSLLLCFGGIRRQDSGLTAIPSTVSLHNFSTIGFNFHSTLYYVFKRSDSGGINSIVEVKRHTHVT
jgi:hypothetical protein